MCLMLHNFNVATRVEGRLLSDRLDSSTVRELLHISWLVCLILCSSLLLRHKSFKNLLSPYRWLRTVKVKSCESGIKKNNPACKRWSAYLSIALSIVRCSCAMVSAFSLKAAHVRMLCTRYNHRSFRLSLRSFISLSSVVDFSIIAGLASAFFLLGLANALVPYSSWMHNLNFFFAPSPESWYPTFFLKRKKNFFILRRRILFEKKQSGVGFFFGLCCRPWVHIYIAS